MTPKAGHTFTAGPAHVEECEQCPERGRIYVHAKGWLDPNELIAEARRTDRDVENGDATEAEANAELIAEAFTVAHETGLTPRQLAERCAKLEAMLKLALPIISDRAAGGRMLTPHQHAADAFQKINAALSKATAGGAV